MQIKAPTVGRGHKSFMTPELLAKYARPVPRYTSYPTAPHFSPTVDAEVYGDWLADIAPGTSLSLYIHVPFCHSLCWFCGCHTRVVNRYAPIAAYVDVLCREIDLVARRLGAKYPVRHVHFGGGSPTIVAAEDFSRLVDRLRRRFDFDSKTSIAIEVDPRSLKRDAVSAYARAGVTRASLGIQDFDPSVQDAVNRIQTPEITAKAIDSLRGAGVDNINLDLMYGLPLQTAEGLCDTIDKSLAFEPARLALFGYAHVPWMKRHQRRIDEASLPDGAERWRQVHTATAHIEAAGFKSIGLDHFAAPDDSLTRANESGNLHRNFQGYTDDGAPVLIGLGASSIGTLPNGYAQNAAEVRDYAAAMSEGRLATRRGIALSDDDRMRRQVIERLMCDFTVDLSDASGRFDLPSEVFTVDVRELDDMARDGLVTIEGDQVSVTELGRPLVRAVCAVFDRYFQAGQGRHSRGV